MSIAVAVKYMLAAGMPHEAIVSAVADMEARANIVPALTPRQARNARYYEGRKGRLKASESVLMCLKASETSENPSPLFSPLLSSPTPPTNNPPIIPPSSSSSLRSDDVTAPARKREAQPSCKFDDGEVSDKHLTGWLAVRKAKRAGPITQTVIDAMRREAIRAGVTVDDAVRLSAENGWQGFRADWLEQQRARAGPRRESRRDDRITFGEMAERLANERRENEGSSG